MSNWPPSIGEVLYGQLSVGLNGLSNSDARSLLAKMGINSREKLCQLNPLDFYRSDDVNEAIYEAVRYFVNRINQPPKVWPSYAAVEEFVDATRIFYEQLVEARDRNFQDDARLLIALEKLNQPSLETLSEYTQAQMKKLVASLDESTYHILHRAITRYGISRQILIDWLPPDAVTE